jgi:cell wall-associated NlpC family hydrolase
MPKSGGINGIAVASIATGGLMVYAGLTGRSVLASVQSLIQGKPLSFDTGGAQHPIAGATAGAAAAALVPGTGPAAITGGSAGGIVIASTAAQYDGAGYVFGGDPSKGIGNWDCSSFANFIVGAKCGFAIPWYGPGKYTGHGHGPVAAEWLTWVGAAGVSGGAAASRPGDLCCWQTHIGIALGGGRMISAVGHAEGTRIGSISGPRGEVLFVRRLKALL